MRRFVPSTEGGRLLAGGCMVLLAGLALGLGLPDDSASRTPLRRLSAVLGWTSFSAWSASFWPQLLSNHRRRSVEGLSFDFLLLNLLGFGFYSAYNLALFASPAVQAQYVARFHAAPSVRASDVAFSLHALVATLASCGQVLVYNRGGQTLSRSAGALAAALLTTAGGAGVVVLAGGATPLTALLVVSYLKLLISACKYVPQAVLNWRRRSTAGWSVHNVLLDATGGAASFAQLLLDCGATGRWASLSGNPTKLGLGLLSLAYDALFALQHYVLYAAPRRAPEDYAPLAEADASPPSSTAVC